MAETKAEVSSRWHLGRGDNLVAPMGLAAAALLICAMGASGLGVMRMEGRSAARVRTRQVDAVGNILAQSSEVMLAAEDLSALRRPLGAGRDYSLTRCRVVIPGNLTVADAHVADINAIQLPANWAGADLPVPDQAPPGELRRQYTLQVAGRGPARLETAAPVPRVSDTLWEAEAGLGAICVLALLFLLVLCRRMRQRFRLSMDNTDSTDGGSISQIMRDKICGISMESVKSVMALRECLLAMGEGERPRSVLTIPEDIGSRPPRGTPCWPSSNRPGRNASAAGWRRPLPRRQSAGTLNLPRPAEAA